MIRPRHFAAPYLQASGNAYLGQLVKLASHVFQWPMRRILAATCALTLSGLAVVAILPTAASASTSSVTIRMGVNAASVTGARNVAQAVVTFRAGMNVLLANYLRDYGDRLSDSELSTVKGLIAQADSSLNGVQNATARTATLAAKGASKAQVLAASKAAEKAYTKSHDQALAALNQITPLLQPKLGLFEALGAKRDADAELAKFDVLGTKITALTKIINASR